jgi:hypothetical protein
MLGRLYILLVLVILPWEAFAQFPSNAAGCGNAVATAEHASRLPLRLLTTISLVESGRPDPVSGHIVAWPWTINAAGTGYFYNTKTEAIAAAMAMHAAGITSIDVGCMQISLLFHPTAFATLDEAFDPSMNAAYGARYLNALYRQTGDWLAAAAAYHSQTPELGTEYQQRVLALWRAPSRSSHLPVTQGTLPPCYDNICTGALRAILRQNHEDQERLMAIYGPSNSLVRQTRSTFVEPHLTYRMPSGPASLWAKQ